jgi:hypothetical protein
VTVPAAWEGFLELVFQDLSPASQKKVDDVLDVVELQLCNT